MFKQFRVYLLPALVGILITSATLFISEWLIHQEMDVHQKQYEARVEGRASHISTRLQQVINSDLIIIEALESVLLLNNQISESDFQIIATTFLSSRPSISQIQLSPNAIIRYVYPLTNSDTLIGLDLRSLPGQQNVIEESIKSGEVILAGPINLVQGGQAFIARKPLYNREGAKKQFWGFITLIIDPEKLYFEGGIVKQDEISHYALKGTDAKGSQGTVFFGDAAIFDGPFYTESISVPGGSWQLAASLRNEGLLKHNTFDLLTSWAMVAALCFGLLSAISCYLWTQLYNRAIHDPLTGLANRQHFQEQAEVEINRAQRYQFSLAMIMIDLDHFKPINDGFGHQQGDLLLKETAQLIRDVLRDSDLIGRYGGEEFIVLVPHSGANRALLCAERIRQTLERNVNIKGKTVQLSASLGVASLSDEVDSFELLVQQADTALYQAKDEGRNRVNCDTQCCCSTALHQA